MCVTVKSSVDVKLYLCPLARGQPGDSEAEEVKSLKLRLDQINSALH